MAFCCREGHAACLYLQFLAEWWTCAGLHGYDDGFPRLLQAL